MCLLWCEVTVIETSGLARRMRTVWARPVATAALITARSSVLWSRSAPAFTPSFCSELDPLGVRLTKTVAASHSVTVTNRAI